MSATKTTGKKTLKPFSLPDGVEITFSARLTPEQRQLVEHSIATMVGLARANADAAMARTAERNMLLDAINAPVAKLIRADLKATEALEKLRMRRGEVEDGLHSEHPLLGGRDHAIAASPTDRILELRVPPFDFAWRWHHQGGDPPFNQNGAPNGRLGLDARSGDLDGGADRVVHAHIGVGCIVRIDRPTILGLSATRSSRHSFAMGALGIGSSANSEGGLETTFMRGGEVLMAGTFPLWQRRLTSGNASERTEFTRRVFPDGMGGRVEPGEYAYNVGIYAVADHSSGVGAAGAQAIVENDILDMRIDRR